RPPSLPALRDDPFLLNAPMLINATLPGDPNPLYVTPFSATGIPLVTDLNVNRAMTAGSAPLFQTFFPPLDQNSDAATGSVGQIFMSGFSSAGVDSFHVPQKRHQNTLQVASTGSWTRSRHQWNFGFDFRHRVLESDVERNTRPV